MNKNNNIETPNTKDVQKVPFIKLKPYIAPKLSLINELDIESGGQNMNESLGTGNLS